MEAGPFHPRDVASNDLTVLKVVVNINRFRHGTIGTCLVTRTIHCHKFGSNVYRLKGAMEGVDWPS